MLRRLLLVFALSLGIRVVWAGFSYVTPVSDFANYHDQARQVLSERSFSNLTFKGPGYPVFLAGLYAIFDEDVQKVAFVQALMGAISSGLVFLLAARVFSVGTATLAGLLHAVSPTMLAYIPVLASENLSVPLLLGTILALDWARDRESGRAYGALVLAGALFALGLLTRSAVLFVLPACILLLVYDLRFRRWNFKKPAVFVAGVVLALSPWIVRNYVAGLGITVFGGISGEALYFANHDSCLNGEMGSPPYITETNPVKRGRMYADAARSWIRQNPGRYLNLCRVRLTRLLGAEPDYWAARALTPLRAEDPLLTAEFRSMYGSPAPAEIVARAKAIVDRNLSYLTWLNVASLSPLVLLALVLSLARWREVAVILLPVGTYFGGLALTVASMRYRVLSDPFLYILLAALLSDLFTRSTELGQRPPWSVKIALALFAIHTSIFVHATGLSDSFYALRPVPAKTPDTHDLVFESAKLDAFAPAWVYRSDVRIKPTGAGLECMVSGGADVSAAQYGGLSLNLSPCEALRLDLTIVDPLSVREVFVELVDAGGGRLARWRWDVTEHPVEDDSRGTYVFVRGKPVRWFVAEGKIHKGKATAANIFVQVAPQSTARFILHRVETGTATRLASQPASH